MARERTARLTAAILGGRPAWQPGLFGVRIDTREQAPWTFAEDLPVTVGKLDAGDYAPIGLESHCAIERKSLSDFIGSVTWERERFTRELERLREYDFAAVIVEASRDDILLRRYRQRVEPEFILSTIALISVRFVPVFLGGNRSAAADMAVRLMKRFHADRRGAE